MFHLSTCSDPHVRQRFTRSSLTWPSHCTAAQQSQVLKPQMCPSFNITDPNIAALSRDRFKKAEA